MKFAPSQLAWASAAGVLPARQQSAPRTSAVRFNARADSLAPAHGAHDDRNPSNDGFAAMLAAFRNSGGLARPPELLSRLRRRSSSNTASLIERVAQRQVLCFKWQLQCWFPCFQFDPHTMALVDGLAPVLLELTDQLDPWELSHWFARPNGWLAGRVPVDVFCLDKAAVLHAARADRFIASG